MRRKFRAKRQRRQYKRHSLTIPRQRSASSSLLTMRYVYDLKTRNRKVKTISKSFKQSCQSNLLEFFYFFQLTKKMPKSFRKCHFSVAIFATKKVSRYKHLCDTSFWCNARQAHVRPACSDTEKLLYSCPKSCCSNACLILLTFLWLNCVRNTCGKPEHLNKYASCMMCKA